MATGSNIEEIMSEEYQRGLSIHVNYCDPCQDDDIQIQAEGFCVDCNDYLCSDCYKAHKKARLSRHHILQDKTSMPTTKPSHVTQIEKCLIHEEAIKWYCKFHDVTVCDLCQAAKHKLCEGVESITDVCGDIFNSTEFTKFQDNLASLEEKFNKHLTDVKMNVSDVESTYRKVIEEVTKTLTDIRDKDLEQLKSLETMCDASLKTVKIVCAKLESLENSGEKEQAFVVKRRVESQLSSFEEILKSISLHNEITKYRFAPTTSYIKTGMIGTLCETRYRITPVKLGDINVKSSSDTDDYLISGIDRLDGNRLVVADKSNSKLKLVDVNSKNVTAEIKLDETPWDLTKIDDKNIAVTTFSRKKVFLVSVSDRLSVNISIDESHYTFCQGIVYYKGSLAVSYHNPNKIEILDLNGTVKHTIENKYNDGIVRFGDVEYIAKNRDADTLYLSDRTHDKVLSMKHDGKIVSSFNHQYLKDPKGITVGRDGRIFVCSYSINKIYELSSDLSNGEIILDQQNGIQDHIVLCMMMKSINFILVVKTTTY